jgi:hypothetical protein
MKQRKIEEAEERDTIAESRLLRNKETAEHCHRRLVTEYLQRHWGDVDIVRV